ncbi:hypothetical protein CRE_07673 [Caenorhabditis remanei]|uniref:Uncharacterized protein n=1 Tax=Caenorhabditis remanei TaxID=31234 RepID=E3MZU4_CAERE|nr:hypothetical protein CRE_07673 [Caenorhabditis remanei]
MQSKSPNDGLKGNEADSAEEQMKKKTQKELEQMAIVNRAFSAESSEDPPPLSQKPSESTLAALNSQLKSVPLVKAFNSAENKLDQNKK